MIKYVNKITEKNASRLQSILSWKSPRKPKFPKVSEEAGNETRRIAKNAENKKNSYHSISVVLAAIKMIVSRTNQVNPSLSRKMSFCQRPKILRSSHLAAVDNDPFFQKSIH